MANSKELKAKPVDVIEKQEVYLIEEMVEVDGESVQLVTKVTVDCRRATFKIQPQLTTKHVHPTNPEHREALVQRVANQLRAGIEKAMERREYWADIILANEPADGQLPVIEFAEDAK